MKLSDTLKPASTAEASGTDKHDMAAAPTQVQPVFDTDYARIFTKARCLAWQYGYACLQHGTRTRDLDILLVPWMEAASSDVDHIIKRIADVNDLNVQDNKSTKPHGRVAYTLMFKEFGDPRWIDVSVMLPRYTCEN